MKEYFSWGLNAKFKMSMKIKRIFLDQKIIKLVDSLANMSGLLLNLIWFTELSL